MCIFDVGMILCCHMDKRYFLYRLDTLIYFLLYIQKRKKIGQDSNVASKDHVATD
jgi:hypothetical protein